MRVFSSTLLTTLLLLSTAHAGIQIDSTRVIYPAGKREVTLSMTNDADTPRLLQAWIDDGNEDTRPNTITVPFLVTPPIFRLDPGKGQSLRIVFTGGDVARDRESVYWLNVLEVQPRPPGKKEGKNNYVQCSVRSRLKIFYRPAGLPGSPKESVAQLRWRRVVEGNGQALECDNPTAFNVSFNDVRLKDVTESEAEKQAGMCPAKGQKRFTVRGTPGGKVTLTVINDYGSYNEHEANYTQ